MFRQKKNYYLFEFDAKDGANGGNFLNILFQPCEIQMTFPKSLLGLLKLRETQGWDKAWKEARELTGAFHEASCQ